MHHAFAPGAFHLHPHICVCVSTYLIGCAGWCLFARRCTASLVSTCCCTIVLSVHQLGSISALDCLHRHLILPSVDSGVALQSMDYTRWIALMQLLFMVPYAGPLMLWSTLMACLDGLQGPHFFVCLCTCLHQLATWPFAQLQGPSFLPLPRWLRLLLADLWTVGHRYSIAACYAHVRAETGMYSRWCGMQSLPYQGVPRPHLPASSFFARPAHVAIGPCLLRIQIEWWTQLTDAWAGPIRSANQAYAWARLLCVDQADSWAERIRGQS